MSTSTTATFELFSAKSSTSFTKHCYFTSTTDGMDFKYQLASGAWKTVSYSLVNARAKWANLLTRGWANAETLDKRLVNRDLPFSQDNCKHKSGFEGRCDDCGYCYY